MDKIHFYQQIKNFDSINESNTDMNAIIRQYPYFMLARLLQAKTQKSEINILTSLFSDRKLLYSLIKNEKITTPVPEEKIENCLQEIVNNPVAEEKKENNKNIIVTEETQMKTESKNEGANDLQSILQQRLNEIKKSSSASNNEKPNEEADVENIGETTSKEEVSLDELIEKFNTNYPKISCSFEDSEEDETYDDLCKNSVAEKMNIVTETLANVYKEQGQYDKAIKIYKTLMTRYPEKNSTFAALIEELKQIKNSQQI
jgi:tetratricopeptide (TPR) repeat protein